MQNARFWRSLKRWCMGVGWKQAAREIKQEARDIAIRSQGGTLDPGRADPTD